jgi:hypothetical protein
LDKVAELKATLEQVRGILTAGQGTELPASVPRESWLDMLRFATAQSVSKVVPLSVDVLMPCVEICKGPNADIADFCIQAARLRIKGNPAELALSLAPKVRLFLGLFCFCVYL